MAERPLLALPRPRLVDPPKGTGGGAKPHLPTKGSQIARFGPDFRRLRDVLARGGAGAAIELRDDPTSLAPDRVIVFEIAGTVADFTRAISKVPGLDFMAEYDTEESPDERFAELDTIEYWREELARDPGRSVRTEVELWFYRTPQRRQQAVCGLGLPTVLAS